MCRVGPCRLPWRRNGKGSKPFQSIWHHEMLASYHNYYSHTYIVLCYYLVASLTNKTVIMVITNCIESSIYHHFLCNTSRLRTPANGGVERKKRSRHDISRILQSLINSQRLVSKSDDWGKNLVLIEKSSPSMGSAAVSNGSTQQEKWQLSDQKVESSRKKERYGTENFLLKSLCDKGNDIW